jgi:hypothetical protein
LGLKEYTESVSLFAEARGIYRGRMGEEHAKVIEPSLGLARIELSLGEFERARGILESTRRICRTALPVNHWSTAATESSLGECMSALGEYEEAERLLVGSFKTMEAARGLEDGYVQEALQRLIDHYDARGEGDKAAAYRAMRDEVKQSAP